MSIFDNFAKTVELYTFKQGDVYYRYCNTAFPLIIDDFTYLPANVKRSAIVETTDFFKGTLTLTFDLKNAYAAQFLGQAPEDTSTLELVRVQRNDTEKRAVLWKGRVMGAVTSGGTIKLTCDTAFTSLANLGLRGSFQRGCRHPLYSAECGADEEANTVSVIITSAETQVELGARLLTNGDLLPVYGAGILTSPSGATRYIHQQTGNILSIDRAFNETILVGSTCTVTTGCDQSYAICKSRFNNTLNYGGYPWISPTDPYKISPF